MMTKVNLTPVMIAPAGLLGVDPASRKKTCMRSVDRIVYVKFSSPIQGFLLETPNRRGSPVPSKTPCRSTVAKLHGFVCWICVSHIA